MTTRKPSGKSCCPACHETDEKCATGRTCRRWRLSWEVCATFGTLPTTIPPETMSPAETTE